MHPNSLRLMTELRAAIPAGSWVADWGAKDAFNDGGVYRPLFADCHYQGIDIEPGQNVDLVVPEEGPSSLKAGWFCAVISGQCLEHTKRPWLVVKEMARVLKPGGVMILIAPWQWCIHRHPVDCWRILPDGMRVLCEDAGLTVERCDVSEADCYAVARKPN
jgi:SAM-dependent methyltransferase